MAKLFYFSLFIYQQKTDKQFAFPNHMIFFQYNTFKCLIETEHQSINSLSSVIYFYVQLFFIYKGKTFTQIFKVVGNILLTKISQVQEAILLRKIYLKTCSLIFFIQRQKSIFLRLMDKHPFKSNLNVQNLFKNLNKKERKKWPLFQLRKSGFLCYSKQHQSPALLKGFRSLNLIELDQWNFFFKCVYIPIDINATFTPQLIQIRMFFAIACSLLAVVNSLSVVSFSPTSGSLAGGTVITVTGEGFGTNINKTSVSVAGRPCAFANGGLTDNFIICSTSFVGGSTTVSGVVSVTVGTVTVSSTAQYSYATGSTPVLQRLYDTIFNPGDKLSFFGTHIISDIGGLLQLGDIVLMTVGDTLCSRFDINDPPLTSTWSSISCISSTNLKAGFYNVSQNLAMGFSRKTQWMLYYAPYNPYAYNGAIPLVIKSLSTNKGSFGGNSLTIVTQNLNSTASLTVEVAGVACKTTVMGNSINCYDQERPTSHKLGQMTVPVGTVQADGYLGQMGILYKTFNLPSNADAQEIANDYNKELLVAIGQPSIAKHFSIQVPQSIVGVFSSYIHLPTAGSYKFFGDGDNMVLVRIYTVPNTTNTDNSKWKQLLLTSSYAADMYIMNPSAVGVNQGYFSVEAGKEGYYYIEAYMVNTGGRGQLFIGYYAPYCCSGKPQVQLVDVQALQFSWPIVPQKWTFSVAGAGGWTIKAGGVESPVLNVGMSDFMITRLVRYSIPKLGDYKLKITSTPITDGKSYVLQMFAYRPDAIVTETNDIYIFNKTLASGAVITQPASQGNPTPSISGTFDLTLAGNVVTSGVTLGSASSYYLTVFRNAQLTVTGVLAGSWISLSQERGYFMIEVTLGRIDTSTAVIGAVSTTFAPLDRINYYRLPGGGYTSAFPINMVGNFIPSSTPTVVVKNNGIFATSAVDAVKYAISTDNTPTLTSSSLSSNTLSLALTVPAGVSSLTDLSVTVGGIPCTDLQGTVTSLTCTLATTSSGQIAAEGGNKIPRVLVNNYGYSVAAGASPVAILYGITSVTPSTIATSGGVPIKVVGFGFPFKPNPDFTLTVCGVSVPIGKISNTEFTFTSIAQPNSGCTAGQEIQITWSGATAKQTALTYDSALDITVTGLNPVQACPVRKGTITITGTNFGTDPSALSVALVAPGKPDIPINVNAATNTQLTCTLGGGPTGDYTVVVRKGSAKSIASPSTAADFKYKMSITGLNTGTGSKFGGTTLTITGVGFPTDKDSIAIIIGDAINNFCSVKSTTGTSITCVTPAMPSTQTLGTAYKINIYGLLIELAACEISAGCTFTFADANTPTITSISPAALDSSMTLVGTRFAAESVVVLALGSTITRCTTTVVSDTSITFTAPISTLVAGSYSVYVQTNEGRSNSQSSSLACSFSSSSAVTSMALSVSTNGGTIQITGIKGLASSSSTSGLLFRIGTVTQESKAFTTSGGTLTFIAPPVANAVKLVSTYILGSCSLTVNLTGSTALTKTLTLTSNTVSWAEPTILSYSLSDSTPLTKAKLIKRDAQGKDTKFQFQGTVTSGSLSFSGISAGEFTLVAETASGFVTIADSKVVITTTTQPTISPTPTVGFAGGKSFTITGDAFSTNAEANFVTVCGNKAVVTAATATTLTVQAPTLVTAVSNTKFKLASNKPMSGNPISDQGETAGSLAFDMSTKTSYSSTSATCYVGLDLGVNVKGSLYSVKYTPNPVVLLNKMRTSVIEGSNDGTSFTAIGDLKLVHSGINTFVAPASTLYRFYRIRGTVTGGCDFSEIAFIGVALNQVAGTLDSTQCDVAILSGSAVSTVSNGVSYSQSATPYLTASNILYVNSAGGENIQLTGTAFGTDSSVVSVKIDGLACTVTAVTDTQISCTSAVQMPSAVPAVKSFEVIVNGNKAAQGVNLIYVYRWSDSRTWGGDVPPVAGDLILLPDNLVLLVDQDVPSILGLYSTNGGLIFEDAKDLSFSACFVILTGGYFRAGTEEAPFRHKLTLTFYGTQDKHQIPVYGSKALICVNCDLQIYGLPKAFTWTRLSSSLNVGDTTITVDDQVDWAVGDVIAVSSTSFNSEAVERFTITAISGNTITLNKAATSLHYAGTQSFGGAVSRSVKYGAEVALLTRNVVFRGDSTSANMGYGAVLTMSGSGYETFNGKIGFAQFTLCGQPMILGRYCIHYHMVDAVPNSFVRGVAVHDSYARAVALHATHFVTLEKNVGCNIEGHNIFLEEGIQMFNIIRNNVMMNSVASERMLATDTSVACYWVTNPSNTFTENAAAGSQFYGAWYEIMSESAGASDGMHLCPPNLQLSLSSKITVHSSQRYGLRTFGVFATTIPCQAVKSGSSPDGKNPDSPNLLSTFQDYVIFKSSVSHIYGELQGYTNYQNFVMIDSKEFGVRFEDCNKTVEPTTVLDSLIALSTGPNFQTSSTFVAFGLPRTEGFKTSAVDVNNYNRNALLFHDCLTCGNIKTIVTGGRIYQLDGITFFNTTGYGKLVTMEAVLKNDVIWFPDGKGCNNIGLANTYSTCHILSDFPHNRDSNCAVPAVPFAMAGVLVCSGADPFRTVWAMGVQPSNYNQMDLYMARLDSATSPDFTEAATTWSKTNTIQTMMVPDQPQAWAQPFRTGFYYQVKFAPNNLDINELLFRTTTVWPSTDKGVVWRFTFNQPNDGVEMFDIVGGVSSPHTPALTSPPDPATCGFGDFYLDTAKKWIYVCISGKNRVYNKITRMVIKPCSACAPKPPAEPTPTTGVWSATASWPNTTLPIEGDNVDITVGSQITLDVNTPVLKNVNIYGKLIIPNQDVSITAAQIWIAPTGSIVGGSPDAPLTRKVKILINGEQSSAPLNLNGKTYNKVIANSGTVALYGAVPSILQAKLIATAEAGSTTLTTSESTGWSVGDTIIVGTSKNNVESEKVTISAISGTTITLSAALAFSHYGAPTSSLTTTALGVLDTRTVVAHLSRNIVFGNKDTSGWGCAFWVNRYKDKDGKWHSPTTTLVGVEFNECSQANTLTGAINVDAGVNPPTLTAISIHDNLGIGSIFASKAILTKSIFYKIAKHAVFVEPEVSGFEATDNLFFYNFKRQSTSYGLALELTCAFTAYGYAPLVLKNNKVIGAQEDGFCIKYIACGDTSRVFQNNEASYSSNGVVMTSTNACSVLTGFFFYGNNKAIMANPSGIASLTYEKMLFTDNGVNLNSRGMTSGLNSFMMVKSCLIYAFARPTSNIRCPTSAVKLLTTSMNAEDLPPRVVPTAAFQTQCTGATFEGRLFVVNTTILNFKESEFTSRGCGGFTVFAGGAQTEMFAPTIFQGTTCNNCDRNQYFRFIDPSGNLGWMGGCGVISCMGQRNTVVRDTDGLLTGRIEQIIPNNDMGKALTYCQRNSFWNGYECLGTNIAEMVFENNGRDSTSKVSHPIWITPNDKLWSNQINGQMEWAWNGPEPMNKRLNRFETILEYGKAYNFSYTSGAPGNTRYKFIGQSMEGSSGYVIINTVFAQNMSVQVTNSSGVVRPIFSGTIEDNIYCGANLFDPLTITVTFVVTDNPKCLVGVAQVDAIIINTRIQTTMAAFVANDGPTKFVNNLMAVLGVTFNQVKIVGLKEGSLIINYVVQSSDSYTDPLVDPNTVVVTDSSKVAAILSQPTTTQSQLLEQATKNTAVSKQSLSSLVKQINAVMTNAKAAAALTGGYEVLSFSVTVAIDDNGTVVALVNPLENKVNLGLIIGLCVGGFVLILIIIGVVLYLRMGHASAKIEVVEMEGIASNEDKEIKEVEFSVSQKF